MSEANKEFSAGFIIYRKTSQGVRFLLLYHGGDYWYFPKGHIEGAEKSLETAIRETTEETGLKRNELKINNKFKSHEEFSFFKGKTKILKTVIFYLAETRNRNIKLSYAHDGYGWFSYKEAVKILSKHKDNILLLKKAHSFIAGPHHRNDVSHGKATLPLLRQPS